MAHGVNEVLSDENTAKLVTTKQQSQHPTSARRTVGTMGSRRIFAPAFKIKVLDSYRQDLDCRGNQRATARKYGIHRRQIQKWLQCEENLRSCCADSVNSGNNDSSELVVTQELRNIVVKNEGSTDSIASVVTPASPALNLNPARLHGDELAVQQGPPLPSHPQPPSHGSPSTADYGFHASLPLHSSASNCHEFSSHREEQYPHSGEYEDKLVIAELQSYKRKRSDYCSEYFSVNTKEYVLEASSMFRNRSEVKLYQPLSTYHPSSDPRYGMGNDVGVTSSQYLHNAQNRHHYHAHQHHQQQNTYESLNSPGDGKTHAPLLAPVKIKTERASPDSAATPGPYETAGSPGAGRTSLSPSSHTAVTTTNVVSAYFDPQTIHRTSSPVHAHVHDHAHSGLSDSVKPRQHQEGQVRETVKVEGEEPVVKEEREVVERELDEENEEGEGVSCTDYQRPPAASSLTGSEGPSSPTQVRIGTYSEPASPQGTGSSCRSTSSFSDSEVDGMEYLPAHQNAAGDLTRRRSFSLQFKLQVLDAFHHEEGVAGNQRATARKFGINRRQVQKWLGQENELRGIIELCGNNTRQRLGPVQDVVSTEKPVDLRMRNPIQQEPELGHSPVTLVQCSNLIASHASHIYPHVNYGEASEMAYMPCDLRCCTQNSPRSSQSGYQDVTLKRPCYLEPSVVQTYCYSTKETNCLPDQGISLKRARCNKPCCRVESSSKRLGVDIASTHYPIMSPESTLQESPLCLVMPKIPYAISSSPPEPVSSTVPTPPAPAIPPTTSSSTKKDGILFKPYLDNPISKPSEDSVSPLSNNNNNMSNNVNNNNNNNNCRGACGINVARDHNLALELNLRGITWGTHPASYSEYPPMRSAFVRYPASPHYTKS